MITVQPAPPANREKTGLKTNEQLKKRCWKNVTKWEDRQSLQDTDCFPAPGLV